MRKCACDACRGLMTPGGFGRVCRITLVIIGPRRRFAHPTWSCRPYCELELDRPPPPPSLLCPRTVITHISTICLGSENTARCDVWSEKRHSLDLHPDQVRRRARLTFHDGAALGADKGKSRSNDDYLSRRIRR
ncbi:hypothetical protein M433DRAFT_327327 [Acidomyces richmondensis BFW]|nr:MAG: hypothetical protein FE78DRAFT_465422 [Acidomyces sp. 'richmondensis']KYG43928.1 hypothetical protein M433DRAFT_327327 [Acidomyces richmondensis BFW]